MYTEMLTKLFEYVQKCIFEVYPFDSKKFHQIEIASNNGNKQAKALMEAYEHLRMAKTIIRDALDKS